MSSSILTPEPLMETLEQRIARQVAREFARNPLLRLPKPGHPDFVGPLRPYATANFYDPRENVPGRTYWGD
jgi:hypothetical protein